MSIRKIACTKRELTQKKYYHYFHSMWSRLQKPLVLFVFRPIWHAACNCVLSLSSLKEEFMSINRKSLMDFIICRMYLRKFSNDIVFKENIFTWGHLSLCYENLFYHVVQSMQIYLRYVLHWFINSKAFLKLISCQSIS